MADHITTKRVWLVVLTLTLLIPVYDVSSRWSEPKLIHEGDVQLVKWSPDSERVVFFDLSTATQEYPAVKIPTDSWIEYNLTKAKLTRSNIWQLQPQLTQEQMELLKPATFEEFPSVLYQSPDRRYMVFGRRSSYDDYFGHHVTIADLQQNVVQDTSAFIANPSRVKDYFDVLWSEDSSSFVTVSLLNFIPTITHFTQYRDDLSKIVLTPFELVIRSRRFAVVDEQNRVFDISPEGQTVLLIASEESRSVKDSFGWQKYLIVWNPANPASSVIIDTFDTDKIRDAAFASNNLVRMITDKGLVEYTISTETLQVIDSTFTADSADFSPDANHVVLFRREKDTQQVFLSSLNP
jgi:hypothetical protein